MVGDLGTPGGAAAELTGPVSAFRVLAADGR
jgi:hypothetical protein